MWTRLSSVALAVALGAGASSAAAEAPRDTDGDGILDEHEEILGTDPAAPDVLRVVLEDGLESDERRKRDGYDATKDFTRIAFCHVGGDRYLWRATFPTEPRLEDTVFHLYVNADANAETGRKGPPGAAFTGTEYMLSVVAGRGTSGYYDPEGNRTSGPPVTPVVQGNALTISADVNLGRDERGIRYALYVLCHTVTKRGERARMSDSSAKKVIAGVPLTDRKKIMRPCDHTASAGVDGTFGLDILRGVLRAKDTLVVPHDELELDGFIVDQFTSRRWPHVRRERPTGTVGTRAPKPGEYYVAFMMYDDSRDERVAVRIDGSVHGVAVANRDNNRTWLYWLREPRRFRGGERIELAGVGSGGKHGICNVLFLSRPPEIRRARYAVEHMAAVSHAGRRGRVTISWTTTWPCATRFEYGSDTKYGKTVETGGHCLVHRVVLDGLDPKAEYHGRAVGTAPRRPEDGALPAGRGGRPFYGDDFVFRAAPPVAPKTPGGLRSVPLTVANPHPFPIEGWPVTTGVPFPKGELADPDRVRLLVGGKELPAQVRLTARWPDGSVKWLLVTFFASAPAGGESVYRLEFGRLFVGKRKRRARAPKGLSVTRGAAGITVDAGTLRFRIDPQGEIADLRLRPSIDSGRRRRELVERRRRGRSPLARDATLRSEAKDAKGGHFTTTGGKAELVIEEVGPLRAVVKVVSHLADENGAKLLRIEKRIEAYSGAEFLRVHHTFVVEGRETFTDLKELSYRIPARPAGGPWSVALLSTSKGGGAVGLEAIGDLVRQRFDDEFVTVDALREVPAKGRVVGSIHGSGPHGCAIAVRDFWQNYPKGFSVRPDGLHVDLCPAFEPGLYDEFPFEKEGHHLYYYLLDGRYRFKQGVAKTHELFLCFGPRERRERLCAVFGRPLVAAAAPEWYCGSKAFYDVAPRDTVRFRLYEEAIDRNLKAYAAARERVRDYGMLNYGDWYPERRANWGNVEYDTQHAFFLEYIRSGNPDAFFLGEATELHNRDVDTVQWSPDPKRIGAVYIHQMCHVGGYYTESVPGTLGFPSAGFTVSHAWVEGHFDHYFLTGDRRSYETGCAIADYFIRKEFGRPYDFSTTRVPGWHLILNAAAYAATGDPYYLNASRVLVDRVLETQDTEPRPLPEHQRAVSSPNDRPYQVGGWSRMMVPGHCRCEPRHRGNAGFMVAVLLSGLKYYHDVTGDPRVKECIIRGAHYLLDECYSDETMGFRYTSCPKTRYGRGASPLMVEGIARAYLWTKDERFRRVLTEALPLGAGGSRYGKGFSMYYRMAPRVLADLAAAGIALDKR